MVLFCFDNFTVYQNSWSQLQSPPIHVFDAQNIYLASAIIVVKRWISLVLDRLVRRIGAAHLTSLVLALHVVRILAMAGVGRYTKSAF